MIHRLTVHLPLACLLAVGLIAAPKVDAAATAPERFQALLARSTRRTHTRNGRSTGPGLPSWRIFSMGHRIRSSSSHEPPSAPATRALRSRISRRWRGWGCHSRRSAPWRISTACTPVRFPQRAARDGRERTADLTFEPGLRISDPGLLPEHIAYDPARGEFLLTSVLEARIVGVTPRGQTRTFARAPDGWPMLARPRSIPRTASLCPGRSTTSPTRAGVSSLTTGPCGTEPN